MVSVKEPPGFRYAFPIRTRLTYPDVVVEMRCKNSDKIKAAVDNGTLDIGICTQVHEGGQVISHDPVVWATHKDFVFQSHKPLAVAVFDKDCIFRTWALDALEKSGTEYRIVYVSQSISGLIDAVRAGLAVAPIIASNVPSDLMVAGLDQGLPVLPVSNIVLHKEKQI